jgi:hypothetical protein
MPSELSEVETFSATPKQPISLESAATVARRLDRSVRTVDRYVEVGILPEPLRIRGRRFWPAGVMPKIDAA